MPVHRASMAVTDHYEKALDDLATRAEVAARAAWEKVDLSNLDRSFVPVSAAVSLNTKSSQREAVRLSSGYVSAFMSSELGQRVAPPKVNSNDYVGRSFHGKALDDSVRAALIKTKMAVKEGKPDPKGIGLRALIAATDLDVRTAGHNVLQDSYTKDQRITGWRRAVYNPCPACLAAASDLDQTPGRAAMKLHPHCRCVPEPVIAGMAEKTLRPSGIEQFKAMSNEQQNETFGDRIAAALREGSLSLGDLVETDGGFIKPKPMKDLPVPLSTDGAKSAPGGTPVAPFLNASKRHQPLSTELRRAVAEGAKDAGFEHAHPRDRDGRWTDLAGAVNGADSARNITDYLNGPPNPLAVSMGANGDRAYNAQVLDHGKAYTNVEAGSADQMGEPHGCFSNAILAALSEGGGAKYVEGYAWVPGDPAPIQHAWVADAEGHAFDVTPLQGTTPADVKYFGVPIDPRIVSRSIAKREVAGPVLDWPEIQQALKGKTFATGGLVKGEGDVVPALLERGYILTPHQVEMLESGKAFDPHEPRDPHTGEWTHLFASPARSEIQDASAYYQTPRWQHFESDVRKQADDLGVTINREEKTQGIWSNTPEPSATFAVSGHNSDRLAARIGRNFNQDAVLRFKPNENGPDAEWHFRGVGKSKSAADVLEAALANGLFGATRSGPDIIVVAGPNMGSETEDQLRSFAAAIGATNVDVFPGEAKLIERHEYDAYDPQDHTQKSLGTPGLREDSHHSDRAPPEVSSEATQEALARILRQTADALDALGAKGFDPREPRDPHTGRWISRGGGESGHAPFQVPKEYEDLMDMVTPYEGQDYAFRRHEPGGRVPDIARQEWERLQAEHRHNPSRVSRYTTGTLQGAAHDVRRAKDDHVARRTAESALEKARKDTVGLWKEVRPPRPGEPQSRYVASLLAAMQTALSEVSGRLAAEFARHTGDLIANLAHWNKERGDAIADDLDTADGVFKFITEHESDVRAAIRATAVAVTHVAGAVSGLHSDDVEGKDFDPNERRDPHTGQWIRVGGGASEGVFPREAAFTGEPTDVHGDVAQAAKLLSEGKPVKLQHKREVTALLDKIDEVVKDAKAKGKKAPVYDLCKVVVPGTNLFCAKTKGIPRIKMPQLAGPPRPGSPAAKLPKDSRGNADITPQFIDHLKSEGYAVHTGTESADHLRPTQMELNGAKIAGIDHFLAGGGTIEGGPLVVSKDNYIVDGHHRWASEVARSIETGKDFKQKVLRVDIGIIDLLREAIKFSDKYGIPQQAVSDTGGKMFDPNQPRDTHGRWTHVPGSGAGSLDIDEAVNHYAGGWSTPINDHLRGITKWAKHYDLTDSQINDEIAAMDEAFRERAVEARQPSNPKSVLGPGHHYRGLDLSRVTPEVRNVIDSGHGSFTDAGFVSTSDRTDIAEGFAEQPIVEAVPSQPDQPVAITPSTIPTEPVILDIRVPPGTKGLQVHAADQIDEGEFVLPRGGSFKLVTTTETPLYPGGPKRRIVTVQWSPA